MQEHDDAIEAKVEAPVVAAVEAVQYDGDPDHSPAELEKALSDPNAKFDPNGKLSPGEFNRRGELFNKIKSMKSEHTKELNALKKHMADLDSKLSKAAEEGYKKALADLQARRMDAVETGDKETFQALDQEYLQLQQALNKGAPAPVAHDLSEDARAFLERNKHWNNDDTPENSLIREEATSFEQRLLQRRAAEGKPNLSEKELAKHIETFVRSKFPHRFDNPEQSKPAAVEGASTPQVKATTSKITLDQLNPIQKAACERFMKRNEGTTVADYVQILRDSAAKQGIGF